MEAFAGVMAGLLWGRCPEPLLLFLVLTQEKEAKESQGAKGRQPSLPGARFVGGIAYALVK